MNCSIASTKNFSSSLVGPDKLSIAFAFMAQEQIKTGYDDEAVASSIS
jgi:hypothetical protein